MGLPWWVSRWSDTSWWAPWGWRAGPLVHGSCRPAQWGSRWWCCWGGLDSPSSGSSLLPALVAFAFQNMATNKKYMQTITPLQQNTRNHIIRLLLTNFWPIFVFFPKHFLSKKFCKLIPQLLMPGSWVTVINQQSVMSATQSGLCSIHKANWSLSLLLSAYQSVILTTSFACRLLIPYVVAFQAVGELIVSINIYRKVQRFSYLVSENHCSDL